MVLLIPFLAVISALATLTEARALEPRAPTHPAFQKRVVHAYPTPLPVPVKRDADSAQKVKRASVAAPAAGFYDTPHTPTWVNTIIRPSGKNAFLEWLPKDGETETWADSVDKYPRLKYSVDVPPGGSDPDNLVKSGEDFMAPIDTGSSPIIFGPDKLGGTANLNNIDPQNYNGYQFFPLEHGGTVVLGRWTKVKITLKGGNANQKVTATPTVLIATYWATGCAGFNPTATPWPDVSNLSNAANRERGVKKCNAPGFSDPPTSVTGNWDNKSFATYFGVGWGNFNKQLPTKCQFSRTMIGITESDGTSYNVGPGSTTPFTHGYTMGRKGIQFGLVRSDDCIYYPLQHSAFNPEDWTRPVGCIEFYNKATGNLITAAGCQTGQILPDSGQTLLSMKIGQTFPVGFGLTSATTGGALTAGSKMRFHLGYKNAPTFSDPDRSLSFDVVAGASHPPIAGGHSFSPEGATADLMYGNWATYGSFVNAGRRMFDLYDMCWDPMQGYVGFRPKRMTTWVGQGGFATWPST